MRRSHLVGKKMATLCWCEGLKPLRFGSVLCCRRLFSLGRPDSRPPLAVFDLKVQKAVSRIRTEGLVRIKALSQIVDDACFKLINRCRIFSERAEGGLRTSRASQPLAMRIQILPPIAHALEAQFELSSPLCKSASHCYWLGRLVVREAECGEVLVMMRLSSQIADRSHYLELNQMCGLFKNSKIRIAHHILARHPEMDDPLGLRA